MIFIAKQKIKSIQSEIEQLIKKQCASYFPTSITVNEDKEHEIIHYCCLENTEKKSCIYFQAESEINRCTYFESCVLPISEILMAKYYDNINVNINTENNKIIHKKRCKRCNNIFMSIKENKQYCDGCTEILKREKSRERSRNYRDNKLKSNNI